MNETDKEFRHWVGENRSMLVRTATLLTAGDSHTAEDVVQTTLTRLYLAWPKVRVAEQRNAYARRALVNAFVDETRRSWKRSEEPRAEVPERLVSLSGANDALDDETTRELYAALRELPERMRAAVVLRYFHGLDVAETARALRCTQGTVKSQTARALGKLRDRLGPLLRSEVDPEADSEAASVADSEPPGAASAAPWPTPTITISRVTVPRSTT